MKKKILTASAILLALAASAFGQTASAPQQAPAQSPERRQRPAPRTPADKPAAPQPAAAPAAPAYQPPQVSFKNDLLTLKAKSVPLAAILEAIGDAARVALVIPTEGVGDAPVSVEMPNYPLEEALRTLLADYDAFFYYGAGEKDPARLQIVWVYPKGKGQGLAPVPPEEWASSDEMRDQLASSDPEQRARAIDALVNRKGSAAQEEVMTALEDDNATVRSQALYSAMNRALDLPPETLNKLATDDASPDVRFLALESLQATNDPNLRALAEQALNDPDLNVQNKAREILSQLDAANQPPAPPRTPREPQRPQRRRSAP